ncbi:MAG: hypothetical protein AAF843_04120 [Bacteroidota bacterium]
MLENIFISFHYDERGIEVADKVKRLVFSHNIKGVTGERLGGTPLAGGVKNKIGSCQAIIIIMTLREEGKTNNWVRDERAYAEGKGLQIITLIEEGVDDEGMFKDNERLRFKFDSSDFRILDLSETINHWRNELGSMKKLIIRPKDISTAISNSIANNPIRYRVWKLRNFTTNIEPNWNRITPSPEERGATLYIPGIRSNDLIEIEANVGNDKWGSPAVNHNLIVELEKRA